MRSDLAVKRLSLISIKSEQVSKICSMIKLTFITYDAHWRFLTLQ